MCRAINKYLEIHLSYLEKIYKCMPDNFKSDLFTFRDPSPLLKNCLLRKHQGHGCDHAHDGLQEGNNIEFTSYYDSITRTKI